MAEGPPEQPPEEPPEEPEEPEEQPAEQPFGSYEQYLEAQVTPRDLYYLEVGAGSGQKGPGGWAGVCVEEPRSAPEGRWAGKMLLGEVLGVW